jgi:hypothetical protein
MHRTNNFKITGESLSVSLEQELPNLPLLLGRQPYFNFGIMGLVLKKNAMLDLLGSTHAPLQHCNAWTAKVK